MKRPALYSAIAAAVLTTTALAGCSAGSTSTTPGASTSAADTAVTALGAATAGSAAADVASLLPSRYSGGVKVASGVYAPMVMRSDSGDWSGFDYDLGQAMAGLLGTTFTFETQDFTSIIPSLQSGKHDIIMFGMNDTTERQKVLDFVDYFQAGLAILVVKGNPDGITGLSGLCGKTVAVAKGTTQADFVKSASSSCASADITVLELPSENDAILAVKSGQAVADVFDAAPAAYTAQTSGGGNDFEVVRDPANPEGYNVAYTGIGTLKENADLTRALQAAVQELVDNGTYAKLLAKYNLSDYAVSKAVLNGAAQ